MDLRPMKTLLPAFLFAALLPTTLSAQIDRESTDVVDYVHLRHATLADVQARSAQGYRISNFEIYTVSPEFQVDCSMVRNTGVYAASWVFHLNKTRAELFALCSQNNARIVDLERYEVGGEERLAALLFTNAGAQAKAWHWHTNLAQGSVYSTISNLGDRIVDIEPYHDGSQWRYHVVSIANSGADQKPWWVYTDTTAANVQTYMAQHDARLYDFEGESLGFQSTCCCVLVRDDVKSLTLWNNGYWQSFDDDVGNGGRVVGLARQGLTGKVITLLDNLDPFTLTGVACNGSLGAPQQSGLGGAFTGSQVGIRCSSLRPWAPTFLVYGLAPQSLSLTPMGAPGCWGYVVPIATELRFANGSGVAADTLNVPADPSYAGLPLLTQFLALDPGHNALGIVSSKRMRTSVRHW
jgi:hypothetical protein